MDGIDEAEILFAAQAKLGAFLIPSVRHQGGRPKKMVLYAEPFCRKA